MKTVAYHNLGCKVNAYEMDAMLESLRQHGYQIVPFEEKADIYIVNTCTVTNIADRKSRQMLHRQKKPTLRELSWRLAVMSRPTRKLWRWTTL